MQVVPPGGTASKHRETQLQLQRKLQEREVIREQKRKLQVRFWLHLCKYESFVVAFG
jgi:hypothetical protein